MNNIGEQDRRGHDGFTGPKGSRSARCRTAIALLACCTVLPSLAQAACHLDTVEFPVKMIGSRATATVGINGTSVPLTVDSGAAFSMLTDAAAAQLALRTKRNDLVRVEGLTGRVDSRTTTVDKLLFLKGEFNHVEFIVGGNEPGSGTMGLMGRNILATSDTEYDLAHGEMHFMFPNDDCEKVNMAYWAGTSPVTEVDLLREYRSKTPAIRARVKLNGQELVALFDTGAGTTVSLKAARRIGIAEADLKPAGISYGAGRGSAANWIAPFEKFEIGGEVISNNRLRVTDFDIDGADMLLGIDFFLSHRIYVSKQQSKMFLTYNGGPVFTIDRRVAATAANPATATETAADAGEAATTADAFARRGAASASRRDYESALADLDRACELEPTTAAWFTQRGTIQEALRRIPKALADYDKALELDPAQVDARSRRAALRLISRDRDGAKADLDALDQALAPQAQLRLMMSGLYLALDQPAQVLAQVDRWLPAHPNEVQRDIALDRRCWARTLLGVELDKAVDDCDDAIDNDGKNAAYLEHRGWAYLRLDKPKKALADFDRSIDVRPANATTLYGRGLAKTRLGDAVPGEADLAAARKLQPNIERVLARVGLLPETAAKP